MTDVIAYSDQSRITQILSELREFSPEVVCGIFSGRPVFRKQKLLFAYFFSKPRLVFNAQLDAYWLGMKTLPRIFRREELLFQEARQRSDEILLIQTEDDPKTVLAAKALLSGSAVAADRIAVLCSEEKAPQFWDLAGVDRVYAYSAGRLSRNWAVAKALMTTRRDVVAALFSGRPIYRLQKLLFFLLPSRNRLVFNENVDCYYLKRGRLTQMLRLPSLVATPEGTGRAGLLLRQAAKGILFLPRLVYLSGWLTVAKLRRVHLLSRTPPVGPRG